MPRASRVFFFLRLNLAGTRYLDLVSQFDHCFWFGDLNYRVDLNAAAELPAGEPPPYGEGETAAHISAARELAEKGDFASLYAADQLSRCQARGEAFGGFTDATPTGFAPTFKVRRQSGTVYKEQRVPSYCDRVLWKSMPPLARCVSKLSFDSLPQVSTSDHKPVLATFAVTPTELMGASPSGMAQGPDAREGTGRDEKKKIGTFRHGSRRPPPASLLLSSSASLRKMSASMTHQLPLIRIQSLQLVGMKDADVGGGSDPYCIFLSNPLDLFSVGGRVPISTVKHTDRRYSGLTRGLTLGAIALSPTNLARASLAGPLPTPMPAARQRTAATARAPRRLLLPLLLLPPSTAPRAQARVVMVQTTSTLLAGRQHSRRPPKQKARAAAAAWHWDGRLQSFRCSALSSPTSTGFDGAPS